MKAIRVHSFGGPEVLRLEDVPEPRAGAGQVVVRVKAAGVNPLDTYIRAGTYARKPALPYTPGSDIGGIVEEVGEGVSRLKKGDRVYTIGAGTDGPARIPVDDPNTHLELTMIHEVMILDSSGPDLAFLQYAVGLKMVLIATLLANLLVPYTPYVAAGYMQIVPLDRVTETNWTAEEAVKWVMSGGIIHPEVVPFDKAEPIRPETLTELAPKPVKSAKTKKTV